jgi:hypothetical protein
MNDVPAKPAALSPSAEKLLRKLSFLVLSIFPVLVSCFLSRAFAPFDGFCPLDIVHATHSPSEHEVLVWRWGSSVGFAVLAVTGIFQRPAAILLLVLTCLSPLLLAVRFYGALHYIR